MAAALATVRIALATRPPRPITRPRSSCATLHLEDDLAAVLDLLDAHGIGVLDQGAGEELDQVAHGGRR